MRTNKVETLRLVLRNPEASDSKEYSKIGVSYYSTGKINNEKKAKKYIKETLKDKNRFEWGLFLKDTNDLIGVIELSHLNWFNFKAGEMSHSINKKWQKKGYGTESAIALINYCFNKMKLHKIYSDTDPENYGAQKLLKKLGFKLEGRIREKNYIDGKRTDELDYGLLKREWKA